MKREKIAAIFADAQRYTEQEITVCGWVRTVRDMKNFGFIELNDGSCFKSLQVVFARETLSNYDEIARQNVGAALIVKGQLVLTPEAKQPFELKAAEIAVEGVSTPDYPLQKKRHSVEFLRTIQHLRPRTNLFSAVFRVRSVAASSVTAALSMSRPRSLRALTVRARARCSVSQRWISITFPVTRTERLTTARTSSARSRTSRSPAS